MKKTRIDSERGTRGASVLSVTRYECVDDGVLLHTRAGTVKIQVCGERIVRVFYTPTGSFPNRESLTLSKTSWPPVDMVREGQGVGVNATVEPDQVVTYAGTAREVRQG